MAVSEKDQIKEWLEKQIKPEDMEKAQRVVSLYRMYLSLTSDKDMATRLTVTHLYDGG